VQQGQLELVAGPVPGLDLRVRRLAIERRIDVDAAGKQKPGASIEGLAGLVQV
jgi:hypothetical protein